MIHVTRHRPDSCACVMEYSWDDQEDQSTRKHHFESIKKCATHAALPDEAAFYAAQVHNKIHDDAITKDLVHVPAFDEKSVTVTAPLTLAKSEKDRIQAICDNEFGLGKVTIL